MIPALVLGAGLSIGLSAGYALFAFVRDRTDRSAEHATYRSLKRDIDGLDFLQERERSRLDLLTARMTMLEIELRPPVPANIRAFRAPMAPLPADCEAQS